MTPTLRRPAALALMLAISTAALPAHAEMTLVSDDIAEGQTLGMDQVLNAFGCEGGNLAPSLAWDGAPEGTKSFVVTAFDPDAPSGSGWWHWSVFNIPAGVGSLTEGVGSPGNPLPEGAITARNDFSETAFGGACPPVGGGPHRYVFTVYAMPQSALPLDETASSAMVDAFANTDSLARASLTGTYER